MYWRIMIIAPKDEYILIRNKLSETFLNGKCSRDEATFISDGLIVTLYPWNGNYHWRGHKADLIYIPQDAWDDLDTRALFQINAIAGSVHPLEQLKWRIS